MFTAEQVCYIAYNCLKAKHLTFIPIPYIELTKMSSIITSHIFSLYLKKTFKHNH